MTLKTFLHCLLWSDKVPTGSKRVLKVTVVWTDNNSPFSCYVSNREVKQLRKQSSSLMICLPDHHDDHSQVSLPLSQASPVYPARSRAQWLSSPHLFSVRGTWQSDKETLSPPLAQRGKKVAPSHRADQQDRLESRTAARGRFLREAGFDVWSANFRTSQDDWMLDQAHGRFLHLWRCLEWGLILHPPRMCLSKLVGASMADP